MKSLITTILLLILSPLAHADSYTDTAIKFIRVTKLEQTFNITRNTVLTRLKTYKEQLLSKPSIKNNEKATKLTEDFILDAKKVLTDVYSWNKVRPKYINAIKNTYSEDELTHINKWLSSKYGNVFIEKQHKFMLETISISDSAAKIFKQKISPIEQEYSKNISRLSTGK